MQQRDRRLVDRRAKKRVMIVFGTRPEAIKVAPVIHALERSSTLEPVVVVTTQHSVILDQVLDLFQIGPHHDLAVIRPRQSLNDITVRVLKGLGPVIEAEEPDLILVQGDTTSTFAGALAGFHALVPVAHMEAGLRTGDVLAPYPEEMNRKLTSQLAALHLAPTLLAKANLVGEGIDETRIVVTGNTVIDALRWTVARDDRRGDPLLRELDRDGRRILLVTAHRRESWGAPMGEIAMALATIARKEPDLLVVFPIHPNPIVRETVFPEIAGLENVRVVEPLAYADFAQLMNMSHFILTDSGGIQEEAPALGKPVLVMREATERPEALACGTARLVGTDRRQIVTWVQVLLHDDVVYAAMASAGNPFGDGQAARRTCEAIAHYLGVGPATEEFRTQVAGEPDEVARSVAVAQAEP
jgi:UDP-N-acetylglucosamine 2-epimerase (non-hydrolysing)